MSDTPWTAGPWEVAAYNAPDEPFVAAIDGPPEDGDNKWFAPQVADSVRVAANARLIASAPEMAELLAKMVWTFERLYPSDRMPELSALDMFPTVADSARTLLSRIRNGDSDA